MKKLINAIVTKDDLPDNRNHIVYPPFYIVALLCWISLLAAQLIMVISFSGEQISDSAIYLSIATKLVKINEWYPSTSDINSDYLFGNGYINLIILCLRLFGNIRVLYYLNILFTQIILFSCLYILKKTLDSNKVLCWFTILFCLLNTFWSEVVHLRTELPFAALCFLSFALAYSQKKSSYILAGGILAISNWIRPLGIAFIIGLICLIIYRKRMLIYIWKPIVTYVSVVLIIGTLTYLNCGYFVYQSTTLGVNLMMSAHDNADGSYMDISDIAPIPKEQRKNMTFRDVDKFYKKQSIEWIINNPGKYISQIPQKIFYLFSTETYSGSSFYNNKVVTGGIDYIKSIYEKVMNNTDEPFLFADFLVLFNQIWYMLIFVLFLIGFGFSIKYNMWRGFAPYMLSLFIGTSITLIIVGGARYHFPYIPVFMMYASLFLGTTNQTKEKDYEISKINESKTLC